jgi:hypothetical protein
MGNVSPELRRPVKLVLARAVEQLPGKHGMPGGSRFELKWDRFRVEPGRRPRTGMSSAGVLVHARVP